jgi:hypothetical protein
MLPRERTNVNRIAASSSLIHHRIARIATTAASSHRQRNYISRLHRTISDRKQTSAKVREQLGAASRDRSLQLLTFVYRRSATARPPFSLKPG